MVDDGHPAGHRLGWNQRDKAELSRPLFRLGDSLRFAVVLQVQAGKDWPSVSVGSFVTNRCSDGLQPFDRLRVICVPVSQAMRISALSGNFTQFRMTSEVNSVGAIISLRLHFDRAVVLDHIFQAARCCWLTLTPVKLGPKERQWIFCRLSSTTLTLIALWLVSLRFFHDFVLEHM